MGTGKASHMVNVIDFGLAKKFRDSKTSTHIPYKQDDYHGVGTSLFAAINTHLGVGSSSFLLFSTSSYPFHLSESSRRDDLESLAYMLIYFIRGTLPWRKIRASPHPPAADSNATPSQEENMRQNYNPVSTTWDLIRDAKIANEELLTLGLPPEFDVLYRYARSLEFDDLPDYAGLRNLFRGLADRMAMEYDGVYDWSVPPTTGGLIGGPGGRSISEGGGSGSGGRRYCEACNARRR